MKLLLAGGGTAGHINPALAIAGYVCQREPATQILYVGAKGGMEERLVPQAGYDFEKIEISGFQRKLSLESLKKNVHTVKLVFSSSREAGITFFTTFSIISRSIWLCSTSGSC